METGALTIEEQIDRDRIEAARADISDGLLQYLQEVDEIATKLAVVEEADHREARRVRDMLKRDERDRREEARREEARVEVSEGKFAALHDATIGPTREQLARGRFRSYTVDKQKGSVRSVTTVRRVLTDRLVQLHNRGVLDDDQLGACVWYRRQWEATGFASGPQTSKFTLAPAGRPRLDHLPPTEVAWEAWQLYRFARDGISPEVRGLFELVVLDEYTIKDAGRASRCGFANASAAFIRAALELHGRVSHLLPIRSL